MKILSFIGLGLGCIGIALAIYLHFEIVPNAEYAEAMPIDQYADQMVFDLYVGQRTEYGQYALLIGGLAFLCSIFPAVKRY